MDFSNPFEEVSLVLAGTPIGNLGDASARLVLALETAEIVACEDTRRLRDLVRRLEVPLTARLLSYHEHNEGLLTSDLLAAAQSGTKVLQVSDAGMPGISDPGFRLVRQASEASVPFLVLPGPCAPLLALVASGLPTDEFRFCGFLPRKPTVLRDKIRSLSRESYTLIFLESPRRCLESLRVFQEIFGASRQIVVARELTKVHEELLRGSIAEVLAVLESRREILGEIVIVVQGFRPTTDANCAISPEMMQKLEQLIQNGVRAKDGAKLLSDWFGISAKSLYDAHLCN